MKTPEEIKRGLVYCRGMACGTIKLDCPYEGVRDCSDAVLSDAFAYIQQLEAQVPRWISEEERLPEVGEKVLVFNDGNMFVAEFKRNSTFEDGYGYSHYFDGDACWMPLPYATEEE